VASPEKVAAVTEIKERIESSKIAIMTQYVGINVEQVTDLRKRLRDADVGYKVYKNNLAKRALEELELGDAASHMDGPTAWTFSEDPVAPAKILKEFSSEVNFVAMCGGVLDGKVVSKEQLEVLASLPSRDQLLAQVVGTIAAPLRNFVGTLNALPRNFVNVLDQIKKQKAEEPSSA
jgi:large subunit ribosomal protein L10